MLTLKIIPSRLNHTEFSGHKTFLGGKAENRERIAKG